MLTSDSDDVHADSEEMRKNIVHFDSSSESASDMLSKLDVYSYEYEPTPTNATEDAATEPDPPTPADADRHFGISPKQLKSELPHVLTDGGFHSPSLKALMIQAIKEVHEENKLLRQQLQEIREEHQAFKAYLAQVMGTK